MTQFHKLETDRVNVWRTDGFDHMAIDGDMVCIHIKGSRVVFNLQTAEQLVDLLTAYCQDQRRLKADERHAQDEWLAQQGSKK